MAGSAIITVDGITLPDSIPRVQYDPLIVAGTLGVWDAGNVKSWPQQAAPSAGSKTLKNLAQSGVLDGDVSVDWTWDATRKTLVRPSATGSRISLGSPNVSDVPRDVAGTVWVYLPSVPTSYSPFMARANSTAGTADNQFLCGVGADGKAFFTPVCLQSDGTSYASPTATAPNAITAGWHQIGWSVAFSGANSSTSYIWVDGVQVASNPYVGNKLNPSTLSIALGNRHADATQGSMAGIGYLRATLEDLTASGRSAAAFISRDWSLNRARVGL